MAVRILRRLAAAAPVPVFVARGGGAGLLPLELAGDPRLRLVASPRHATVLLAAGRFPGAMGEALDRVHDQLSGRTVWWKPDGGGERPPSLHRARSVTGTDPVEAVLEAHREAVLDGAGDPAVLPDAPPNPFEGRGDHGQGGEGMMGGVPYGRPMAMTGDDRDGLALDQLRVVLGPFLPGFPNGLRVHAVLQGGTVQEAGVELLELGTGPPLEAAEPGERDGWVRSELRWLSEALRLAGLPALAARAANLARAGAEPSDCARLARRVARTGLPTAWSGVGVLDGVDARRRLEQRLAFDRDGDGGRPVAPERTGDLLVGQDWADAVVTLWSLDAPMQPSAVPS